MKNASISSNKIIISEKLSKYLFLFFVGTPLFSLVMFTSKNMVFEPQLLIKIFGIFLIIISGIIIPTAIIIPIIFLFIGLPSITFDVDKITLKIRNNRIIIIPLGDLQKIGTQIAAEMVGNSLAFSERYLSLEIKNLDKYNIVYNHLFLPPKVFNNYISDYKGNLYIKLDGILSEKRMTQIRDEFKEKLSITVEQLPCLLKTKDQDIYEKEKARICF